jgi:hypothetical protein
MSMSMSMPGETIVHASPDTLPNVTCPIDIIDRLEYRGCPECGAPALMPSRGYLASTDGTVELMKIQCADGHWFLLPTDRLARTETPGPRGSGTAVNSTSGDPIDVAMSGSGALSGMPPAQCRAA